MSTTTFDLRGLRDRDQLKQVGQDLAAEIKKDDIASLAAAAAFKIVLALFPALLAAVSIFAIVADPADLQAIVATLPDSVTSIVMDRLDTFIEQLSSGGVAVTGILAGLWAASGAAATLNKSLSKAYDLTDDRKIVAARGAALAVTVALLLALIGISVLLVAGGTIEDSVLESLGLTGPALTTADVLSSIGRYLAAVVLLMLLFAFIYWIGPDYGTRPRWVWITPGAGVAVLTWLLASAAFGFYVQNFGSYQDADSPYGPLGSAIVFMLWLQLSMFALLLGAELNQVLRRRVAAMQGGPQAEAAVREVTDDGAGDGTPEPAAVAGATTAPADTGSTTGQSLREQVEGAPPVAPSRAGAGTTRDAAHERPGAHRRLDGDPDGGDAADADDAGAAGSPAGDDDARGGAADDTVAQAAHAGDAAAADRATPVATTPAPAAGRATGTASHRPATGGRGAGGGRGPAGRAVRRPATVAGAAVATVSTLAGLVGLARRLRGD